MDQQLSALADAHGVATWYENADRRRVQVAEDVVRAVLTEMDADASAAPPQGPVVVQVGPDTPPLGYHQLDDGRELIVTPRRLPPVEPAWGWMLQLYALHSPGSWGIGDYADLRDFAAGSHRLGAGVLLVNPVQAITPTLPVQRSPYSPSSRRFANPIYLRVTDTDAFRRADQATRAEVERIAPPAGAELIDYDAVWGAKLAALELLWSSRRGNGQAIPADLHDFATFCALAERNGADWRTWPAGLRRPDSPDVAAAREKLADRVSFHAWLQRLCQRQLADVRAASDVRIVHDLPVGVDPAGADAWALQDVLASNVTVGAPPDAFSQQGQDWNLPPWRPDRLAAQGYRPFRDVIRSVLANADGIRVDHIAGLFRLWWIPPGRPASEGTYVRYDADAMLGILALEAHLAGAIVVGEDLGTVPDQVTETLHSRGMLSSSVLYFERDDKAEGEPLLAPRDWDVDAMASISTHDLPTTAGFLRAENVRVRADLGLVDDPDGEFARAAQARAEMLAALDAHGLLPADATEEDLVVALHRLLATAASRLLLTSPQDALGEPRQPNLPGTIDEYPNWRIPLAPSVDALLGDERLLRAVAALRDARPNGVPPN
jgi:4-alpha-glucanotransferase